MTCDEAENLISARVDGELRADDPANVALDAHLAECAACRAAAEAMLLQDAAIARAFAPARRSAADVAERVVAAALADDATPVPRPEIVYVLPSRARYWLTGLAASVVAAGVMLAAVHFGP